MHILSLIQINTILGIDTQYKNIVTLNRFSSCKRHVSSSTRFSSLSFASFRAPVSLAAWMDLHQWLPPECSPHTQCMIQYILLDKKKHIKEFNTILSILSSFRAILPLQLHWVTSAAFWRLLWYEYAMWQRKRACNPPTKEQPLNIKFFNKFQSVINAM